MFTPQDSHKPVSISTYRFSQMGDIPGTPETIIKSSDIKLHEHARGSRLKEGNEIKVRHSFSLLGGKKKNKSGSSMLFLVLFLLLPTLKDLSHQNSFHHKLHPVLPETADFHKTSCSWSKSVHLAPRVTQPLGSGAGILRWIVLFFCLLFYTVAHKRAMTLLAYEMAHQQNRFRG